MTTPPPPSAAEGSRADTGPGADPGTEPTGGRTGASSKAAELIAAVRAVESGERAATEFFAEPAPAKPARPARPGSAPPPVQADDASAATATTVPPGLLEVLARGGAPSSLAVLVVRTLGPAAEEVLRADPWQLLAVPGVQPEQADGFARALLGDECGPDDPRRGQALSVWLLSRAARGGHTVVEESALTRQLTTHAVPDPDAVLQLAVDEGAVLAFQEENTRPTEPTQEEGEEPPPTVLLGLERWAVAEEGLAEGIQRLLSTFSPGEGDEDWSALAAEAGSPSAAELVHACADHPIVLHTGGEAAKAEPAMLAAAAHHLGLRTCLAAHSSEGRAQLATLLPDLAPPARRELDTSPVSDSPGTTDASPDASVHAESSESDSAQSASTPPDAPYVVTVSGLLSGAEGPARDEEGCFSVDVMVVTDATQLDSESAAALVESLPEGARLVLSGDPQLLGSAGAGEVLVDLLAARMCPQVVSRTPDAGVLGELLSCVGIGELPNVQAPDKELVIVPVREAGEAVHRTVQLVADSVPRAMGVPSDHTQVITVGHEGGAGTTELNTALKQRLNPGPGAFGGFDPGDRVVYSPAPGRSTLGQVLGADAAGLRLSCAGEPVTVPKDRVARTVRHGWAVTAHQAAGSRWPAAVVVLPGDAAERLDRRWVYTALGRGARHVSVVQGVGQELNRAVVERPGTPRVTRLRSLLTPRPTPAAPATTDTATDAPA